MAAIFRFFRRMRRPFFVFFFAGASTCFLWRWRKNRSVFWHLLVSFCDDGGNFFLLGTQEKTFLEVERFWNNFLRLGERVFSLPRSRHRRGSVKLGTFGFHDHVDEASKVFLRHFLLCKHLFSSCGVSRKPNVDMNIFRSHVIRCSLVSLAACFSFSSWRRRLTPITVAETAAKNRHLAASGHLRFLFFLKKKESLFFNKDSLSQSLFFNKDSLSSHYGE